VIAVRFAFLLALAVWIGAVVCFSFIVAPALFRVLDAPRAGEVVGAIFPGYYAVGGAAAAVAVVAGLVLRARAAAPGWGSAAVAAVAVGLAVTAWAGAVVHPRAQRLRVEAAAAGIAAGEHEAFRRAHRHAVALNAAALLAGLGGLGFSAAALRS
jgi:uncharacterized membrane protein